MLKKIEWNSAKTKRWNFHFDGFWLQFNGGIFKVDRKAMRAGVWGIRDARPKMPWKMIFLRRLSLSSGTIWFRRRGEFAKFNHVLSDIPSVCYFALLICTGRRWKNCFCQLLRFAVNFMRNNFSSSRAALTLTPYHNCAHIDPCLLVGGKSATYFPLYVL